MKKNLSEIKGVLHGWTAQSAKWYDDASEYTGYHEKLAEYFLKYLKHEYSCFEIACGTGNMARALAPHVASYVACDRDPAACDFFIKKLSHDGESDIKVICGDWKEALGNDKYDVITTSFFGAETDDWEIIKNAARHLFIAVVPRERNTGEGNGISSRHSSRIESFEQMKAFFEDGGYRFDAVPLALEFGQPILCTEEAIEYIKYYYRLDDEDAVRFLNMKFMREEDGMLYFPKTKKAGIIAVLTDDAM